MFQSTGASNTYISRQKFIRGSVTSISESKSNTRKGDRNRSRVSEKCKHDMITMPSLAVIGTNNNDRNNVNNCSGKCNLNNHTCHGDKIAGWCFMKNGKDMEVNGEVSSLYYNTDDSVLDTNSNSKSGLLLFNSDGNCNDYEKKSIKFHVGYLQSSEENESCNGNKQRQRLRDQPSSSILFDNDKEERNDNTHGNSDNSQTVNSSTSMSTISMIMGESTAPPQSPQSDARQLQPHQQRPHQWYQEPKNSSSKRSCSRTNRWFRFVLLLCTISLLSYDESHQHEPHIKNDDNSNNIQLISTDTNHRAISSTISDASNNTSSSHSISPPQRSTTTIPLIHELPKFPTPPQLLYLSAATHKDIPIPPQRLRGYADNDNQNGFPPSAAEQKHHHLPILAHARYQEPLVFGKGPEQDNFYDNVYPQDGVQPLGSINGQQNKLKSRCFSLSLWILLAYLIGDTVMKEIRLCRYRCCCYCFRRQQRTSESRQ